MRQPPSSNLLKCGALVVPLSPFQGGTSTLPRSSSALKRAQLSSSGLQVNLLAAGSGVGQAQAPRDDGVTDNANIYPMATKDEQQVYPVATGPARSLGAPPQTARAVPARANGSYMATTLARTRTTRPTPTPAAQPAKLHSDDVELEMATVTAGLVGASEFRSD